MNKITYAKLAIGSAFLYQLLLIVLVFLRPDLPIYSTTISEWAIGKYGWLMQFAFFASGLSYLFLFFTLKDDAKGITGKVGLALLVISFLGTIRIGIFVTDPFPPDFTLTTTIIHTICGTLAMLFFPIGTILLALNISKRNELWKSYKSILKIIGLLPLLAFIGFVIHLTIFLMPLGADPVRENGPIGYPPRVMFLTYHLALIAVAYLSIKKEQLKNKMK